ncbi:protein SMAX1-LIKE 3-like [Lolium rigidum]|uniref:protein SMAX1-LIKE 3-like n=1 Tax=Lolium rigidum TaxID=89674 RepID=UPI001F5CD7A5|nr:protein SMAX1-LIKE 3-like [Lolium rigidum]
MRAGGCAVQQALAAEAASVVRQAVTLARRRGHAQVTPLHVATAMLLPPAPAGVLRAACLRSHSHPLQCKALELCFNVALNRLPTASGAAAMFHQHRLGGAAPALSNALVAAFKRAQAHQRRGGSGDGIQQTAAPVIAAKVELEQLIVSILDDPSVSRVMREAGFSSSQVKANVERAVSSSSSSGTNTTRTSSSKESRDKSVSHNDAKRVLDCMASGAQRCLVVVGEGAEAAVKAVMDRVSKVDLPYHQHERLKSVQFVPLSIASFRGLAKEEVDAKAGELRALLREACAAGKGVVLILEDLAYAAEAWQTRRGAASVHGGQSQQHYCPVEHAVMEVSSLVSGDSGSGGGRFWLIGFASSMVFMRCRVGQPSLETVWGIHPVVVPDGGGLVLSLSCTSEAQASQQARRSTMGWPLVSSSAVTGDSHLTCYANARTPSPETSIPSWLRRYHDPYHTTPASSGGSNLEQLQDLWNPTRNGSATHHHTSELTLSFSSPISSPEASSLSGYNTTNSIMMMSSSKPWHLEPRTPWPPIMTERRLDYHQLHTAANPSPESISVQSNSNSPDGGVTGERRRPKFTELTAENLKILSSTLEDGIPLHIKDVAAGVASTVLRCRSGMARRRETLTPTPSSATWLLFQGRDGDGKKAMALELAKLVFGSYNDFTSISSAGFTPVHSGSSSGEFAGKRQRSPDYEHGYPQRFYEVIHENPRRVVMIEDIEQLDIGSEMSIKNAIESGRIRDCNGNEVSLEDAIVVLSCEAFDSRSRASSPRVKQRVSINNNGDEEDSGVEKEKMKPPCLSLDLNACATADDDEERDEEQKERLVDDVEISDVVDGAFFFRLAIGLSH